MTRSANAHERMVGRLICAEGTLKTLSDRPKFATIAATKCARLEARLGAASPTALNCKKSPQAHMWSAVNANLRWES